MLENLRFLSPGVLAQGSRTTVLTSLGWMATILMCGIISGSYFKVEPFIVRIFAVSFCFDFLAYLLAYAYFAWKAPDALRSERYGLHKLAIERGRYGDSIGGDFEEAIVSQPTQSNSKNLIGVNAEMVVSENKDV